MDTGLHIEFGWSGSEWDCPQIWVRPSVFNEVWNSDAHFRYRVARWILVDRTFILPVQRIAMLRILRSREWAESITFPPFCLSLYLALNGNWCRYSSQVLTILAKTLPLARGEQSEEVQANRGFHPSGIGELVPDYLRGTKHWFVHRLATISAKCALKSPPQHPIEEKCVVHPKKDWVTPFFPFDPFPRLIALLQKPNRTWTSEP